MAFRATRYCEMGYRAANEWKRAGTVLFRQYPSLREEVERIQRVILQQFPKDPRREYVTEKSRTSKPWLAERYKRAIKTGFQHTGKMLKGVYFNQYYMRDIMDTQRQINPGLKTELEERRLKKLVALRRRGAGPPKKGAGAAKKAAKAGKKK